MTEEFVKQLIEVINDYNSARAECNRDDLSDILPLSEITSLKMRCVSAIERTAGQNSSYYRRATQLDILQLQIGVANALRSDLENGYTKSLSEVAHANVFGDFIEMARHLLNSGYKDAAAVIAGATLESHLRKLCDKNGVSTILNGKNKKAELMNAQLAKINSYTILDQKSITSWIGLRNDAAHGNYDRYTKEQVELQINGIGNFISRHPA